MLDGASTFDSSDLVPARDGTETVSVVRIALLLIGQHGAAAAEVARAHAARAESDGESPDRDLWRWIIAAVENLLDFLPATDLLYATALTAPAPARVPACAA